MADVDQDETTTLEEEQSNSGASESTDDSAANDQVEDNGDSGQADDSASEDDGGSDDNEAEGDQKTRGEVRHERYIDKLSREIRESNLQTSSSTRELFSPKQYDPLQYEEGEEYDPKALEQDRKAAAENARAEGIQLGLTQGTQSVANELWADRLELDAERVTNRYQDIREDPKLEATLVQKYVQFTGMERDPQTGRINIQRPNVRFKDFVEAEMKEREEYAAHRLATSQSNLTKQAAKAGPRPHGQARTTKGDHGFDPNDPAGSVARMSSKQYFELGGKEASDAYLSKRGLGK